VKRLAVLISGRGSNLQSLLDAASAGRLGGEIALVLSNVASAAGLERARRAGVPALVCEHQGRSRPDHEQAVLGLLREHRIDVVCLAGYMRLLSAAFLAAFGGPVLNVHPSLLPAFRGRDAQQQAWDHGVKVAGATVHLVDAELDGGPILLQEAVPVLERDSPEELAARILSVEHRLYPAAVNLVLGGYRIAGRRVLAVH
jgi:phosphoribosylglycinamide formyltransferase-1